MAHAVLIVALHTLDIQHLLSLKKIRKSFTSTHVLDFHIDTAFTPLLRLMEGTNLSFHKHVSVVTPCQINRQFFSFFYRCTMHSVIHTVYSPTDAHLLQL